MSKLENQVSVQNSSKDCDKCSELQRVIQLNPLVILINQYINETMCRCATGNGMLKRVHSLTEKGSPKDSPCKIKASGQKLELATLTSNTAPTGNMIDQMMVIDQVPNLGMYLAGIDGNVC